MEKDKAIHLSKGAIVKLKKFFFSSKRRISIVIILLIVFGFIGWKVFGTNRQQPQYQTAIVEKGTLVSSLTVSGQVAVANRTSVTTQASGIISEINVANGDTVTQGQQIAVISLYQSGQQKQAQAWASYLSAKSSLDNANASLYSLQSTMYSKWDTYRTLAENSTYQNADGSANNSNRVLPQFTTVQDDWLAAEADYKNQQNTIAQAQASINSSWLSYQAASNIITAPTSGTVSDLIIGVGSQVGSSSNASSSTGGSSTASSQSIAVIKTEGNPVITVSLSEVDATKVKSGQKASLTFDALPNKTFTGKVLGINTSGVVNTGVTTYPASIALDLPNESILPNMSANVSIITNIKDDVLFVPSSAVQTSGDQSTVRILKNNVINSVPVEIGISSGTQTEINSGLNESDIVVTGPIPTGQSSTTGASPFSGGVRMGSFGGGGAGGFTGSRGGQGR